GGNDARDGVDGAAWKQTLLNPAGLKTKRRCSGKFELAVCRVGEVDSEGRKRRNMLACKCHDRAAVRTSAEETASGLLVAIPQVAVHSRAKGLAHLLGPSSSAPAMLLLVAK